MLMPVLPSTDPTAAGRPGRKATHVPEPEEGNRHKAGLALRCQRRKNKGDSVAGMEAVRRQRTDRESRAGPRGQAARRGEELGTGAKGGARAKMELRDVEPGEVGGAERKRWAEVMGRGKRTGGRGAPRGRWVGRGAGLSCAPSFSPLTSSASAFHVGANAMQWPHQEAKNSTAQALRESSTAPRTVSACSSVSASEGE